VADRPLQPLDAQARRRLALRSPAARFPFCCPATSLSPPVRLPKTPVFDPQNVIIGPQSVPFSNTFHAISITYLGPTPIRKTVDFPELFGPTRMLNRCRAIAYCPKPLKRWNLTDVKRSRVPT
jgi:hypothetical protein